ncbi:MAG: hypothetical protein AAF624_04815 [Bacteroidota bacterium]
MQRIAEVIESSTRHLVAEVARSERAPTFGSWVEVPAQDGTVLYALVSHVETGSVEPGRRAMALGMDRATLQREMPQLQELIRTTFRALILGYREPPRPGQHEGRLHQTLPPRPADLHDMVYPCNDATVCALGEPFDFLRSLARHPDPAVPADDLIVAVLRHLHRAYGQGTEAIAALRSAGRTLSRLLGDDHERLESILRRVA